MNPDYPNLYLLIGDLAPGAWYQVKARNFQYAEWTGLAFRGIRTKFGQRFWDEELHYDSNPHYGTCKPLRPIAEQDVPPAAKELSPT